MNKKLFVLGSLILCSLGVLGAPGAQAMNEDKLPYMIVGNGISWKSPNGHDCGTFTPDVTPNSQKFWEIANGTPEQEKPALKEFMNKLEEGLGRIQIQRNGINADGSIRRSVNVFPVLIAIIRYTNEEGISTEEKQRREELAKALISGGEDNEDWTCFQKGEWEGLRRFNFASHLVLTVHAITNRL
ncbi:MAG: hypothetical protein LBG13_03295 [Holosporales bacterium]|nr:hypothetical protein [Holosporales bacterium]